MGPQAGPQKLGLPGGNSADGRGTLSKARQRRAPEGGSGDARARVDHADVGHLFARPARDAGGVGGAGRDVAAAMSAAGDILSTFTASQNAPATKSLLIVVIVPLLALEEPSTTGDIADGDPTGIVNLR